ncbi:MAG TPA: inositol monophosphatase family protein [Actinomycetota bacterium]|nr:inositol monophosphatase family protein [Actinomycetota bacterium]
MFEEELAFATDLAEEAGRIAMKYFGHEFEVRLKPDRTPVTEADTEIEAMIRERIRERYPGDAILGEENGLEGEGDRCWIIDPIDGTKNFADGVQVWATLIALAVAEDPVVGVANAPAIGERYQAARGAGARLNGSPIHVSTADRISRSFVLYSDVREWLAGEYGRPLRELVLEARRDRGYGDFWGHLLVARGSADVMFEPELATWDVAAVRVIVEEAGGTVTTFEGEPPSHGSSALSTNGLLHDEIVARLRHGASRQAGSDPGAG